MLQQTSVSEYTERRKEQEGTDELSGTKSSLPNDLQGYLTQITAQNTTSLGTLARTVIGYQWKYPHEFCSSCSQLLESPPL